MFPAVNKLENSKKENRFFYIFVQILFLSFFFRSERSSEKGPEDSDQNHGFLVEL